MTRYESLDEAVPRQGYVPRVDPEEFWRIAARHERSEP